MNDYLDMTDLQLDEAEVEALLRGRDPRNPDLADLANVVSALHGGLNQPVAEAEAKEAGARLAMAAREAVQGAPKTKGNVVWVRRAAFGGLAALALGFGVAGAAAADSAAPGDSLYGLDRALERVGVHDGGLTERLVEAQELADRGDEDGAIDLLADSLDDAGDAQGKQALLDAAAKLRENGSEQSADVHAGVAAMLTWMATTDATGKDFGQGVAEHARDIHGGPQPTAAPSADPGKPDNAGEGKPTDSGGSDHAKDDSSNGNGNGKPDSAPTPKGGKP